MAKTLYKLPELLARERRKKCLSKTALAATASMLPSQLSRLESGRHGPPAERTVRRLADALQAGADITNELMLARAHDVVLSTLADTPFSRGAELVSEAILASTLLSSEDINTLAWHIGKLSLGHRAFQTLRQEQKEEADHDIETKPQPASRPHIL